jgi:anthranilate 1,2-dioxygenase small subunit
MDNNLQLWLELSELQHRYVHALDNNLLEQWPDFFIEEGRYEIVSKENADRGLPAPIMLCRNRRMMVDRIYSLRHANIFEAHTYRHAVSGLVVTDTRDNLVSTVSSYLVVNTGVAGETTVYQAGSYHDTVIKEGGLWRYKSKRVVYDTSRVATLLATPI